MALLEWLIMTAGAFGGLVALIYVGQRSLMYFPERLHTQPAMAGLPEAQEVAHDTKDGERVIAWHVPPRGEKPVVLYFHCNGGALRNRVARFAELIADGNGLVALSYRGYGGSTGSPTEAGLIADAEAAYAFAAARGRSGSYRVHDLSRDNGKLSEVFRTLSWPLAHQTFEGWKFLSAIGRGVGRPATVSVGWHSFGVAGKTPKLKRQEYAQAGPRRRPSDFPPDALTRRHRSGRSPHRTQVSPVRALG
jgi:hypothetical protein